MLAIVLFLKANLSFVESIVFLFNNISFREYCSLTIPFLFHLICALFVFIMLPFIFVFSMLFFNLSNLCNLVLVFYIYVCTWLRIAINLLRFIIAHHKTLGKSLIQYYLFLQICIFLPFIGSALLISGDIEKNPWPGNVSGHNISICHWNLNGITANNFVKISLLDAYNAVHDFDLVCISETFLDSDYSK